MAIEDLLLTPYLAAEWRNVDFAAWTLPDGAALWKVASPFDSLVKGKTALWYHNLGTGVFPKQTVDPDYDSLARISDVVESPVFDLSAFGSSDDWHFRVRAWWRPEHVLPSLGGTDQSPDRFYVYAVTGGIDHLVGEFDQPILDPANAVNAVELSRVEPQAGNPNVGADGLWWYEQLFTPKRVVQDPVIGQNSVRLRLVLQSAARNASGYGVGVERVAVEIMRGGYVDPEGAVFPINLHRSYINSRRWI